MRVRALILTLPVIFLAACAVRLGGPSPERYDALVLHEPLTADADAVAERIREAGADIVLISSERQDSAWFAYVGYRANLRISSPGAIGGRGYAFMTNLELLGDTTLALDVPGGGHVQMHDALYRIDQYRYLDLMYVRLDSPDVRAAVRALLAYIATDVPGDASVLLGIQAESQAAADSAAVLMRATFGNAAECSEATQTPPVRLLYGPSARVSCLSARPLAAPASGITARIEVGR